jgi:hypothetical protein
MSSRRKKVGTEGTYLRDFRPPSFLPSPYCMAQIPRRTILLVSKVCSVPPLFHAFSSSQPVCITPSLSPEQNGKVAFRQALMAYI